MVKIPTPEEYEKHRKNKELIEELAKVLKVQAKWDELPKRVEKKVKKIVEDNERLKKLVGEE